MLVQIAAALQDVGGLQNPFCDRLRGDVKRLHEERYVKPDAVESTQRRGHIKQFNHFSEQEIALFFQDHELRLALVFLHVRVFGDVGAAALEAREFERAFLAREQALGADYRDGALAGVEAGGFDVEREHRGVRICRGMRVFGRGLIATMLVIFFEMMRCQIA